MTDQPSHSEEDRKLARRIGEARESGTPLDKLPDKRSLIETLLAYKKKKEQSFEIDKDEKMEVWNRISSETGSSSETTIRRLFPSRTVRWAAAAILLVGALLSFLYLQYMQKPKLMAEAGSSITSVRLNDGSMVTLRPHTQLYLLKKDEGIVQYKLEGEALFRVAAKPDRSFAVRTETGQVSVLGTTFVLSSWGSQTQVFLQEGSIKVEALEHDSSIVLKPGQSASIAGSQRAPTLRPSTIKEFTDWLDQQLIFENKSARQVAKELEHQFNISVELPPGVAKSRLTGRLSLQNMQTALRDLEIVLGGTFVKSGDRSYTFESD